jgi:hypothetical protein
MTCFLVPGQPFMYVMGAEYNVACSGGVEKKVSDTIGH